MERLSIHPKGTDLARVIQALAGARGDRLEAVARAAQWRDSPRVAEVLKAAIDAGGTQSGNWGAPLGVTADLAAEWVELLRPMTIAGRLAGIVPAPFNTRIARVTGGATAAWVSQDAPTPVSALALGAPLMLPPTKMQSIAVITLELARLSTPTAEAIIRRDVLATVAAYTDAQFIDPTVTAVTDTNPASITSAAPSVSSTGTSAAQISADLRGLVDAMSAADGDVAAAYWVMHPRSAAYLSTLTTTGGALMFPAASARGGSALGIPILTSRHVPIDTGNDGYVFLIDPSGIAFADAGLEVAVSGHAALQLDDAPADAAAQMVSLWQSNLAAVRCTRWVSWARRTDAAVFTLADVAW